tara:strand:- start:132 stop:620 length:489 start_codon:yes stop_codon:yes gene_type:complete
MKKIPFHQFRYISSLALSIVLGLLIGAGNGFIVGGIIAFILDIFFYMTNTSTNIVMFLTGLPFFYFVVRACEKNDGAMYLMSLEDYMKRDADIAYIDFQTKVLKLNYQHIDFEELDKVMSLSSPDHQKKFIELYSEQYFTGKTDNDAVFKKYKEYLENNPKN